MQPDQRQHRPGQLARGLRLAPGRGAHQPHQQRRTGQQRQRQAVLYGQVQRQVVRVVQNIAKARPGQCVGVERHEVRKIELARAPAPQRLLGDQVEHIAPQVHAAKAAIALAAQAL